VFSFYANKTITTGEGGMLVTRDAALASARKVMRLHGMSRDAFDRFTAKVPSWYYEIVAPGFKYNLTDIAAALGMHQLRRAMPSSSGAPAIAARLRRGLAGLPLITAPARPGRGRPARLAPVRAAPGRRGAASRATASSSACSRRHRLQRALHPAAPAALLARPLRPARRRSSRTASTPTSAC
jgi:dTDP-4-amino-4,6-dideoxygalactose transaminase